MSCGLCHCASCARIRAEAYAEVLGTQTGGRARSHLFEHMNDSVWEGLTPTEVRSYPGQFAGLPKQQRR